MFALILTCWSELLSRPNTSERASLFTIQTQISHNDRNGIAWCLNLQVLFILLLTKRKKKKVVIWTCSKVIRGIWNVLGLFHLVFRADYSFNVYTSWHKYIQMYTEMHLTLCMPSIKLNQKKHKNYINQRYTMFLVTENLYRCLEWVGCVFGILTTIFWPFYRLISRRTNSSDVHRL